MMKRQLSKSHGGAARSGFFARRRPARKPRLNVRRLCSERLEERKLLAGDFHNAFYPPDVTANGTADIVDLFGVITSLRDGGSRSLAAEGEGGQRGDLYVDVNGDDYLSVSDALDVVYELRGEGEAIARDDNFNRNDPNDPFTVESNSAGNTLPVLTNDSPSTNVTVTQVGTLQAGLQGVTATTEFGGQVTVQNPGTVGNTVIYTPAGDFFGQDRFIYEVRDTNDDTLDTAVVTVFVRPDPNDPDDKFVRFTYQALDPVTLQPITEVEQGETFVVRAFVQDIRDDFQPPEERGVAAAALDVTYNSNFATLVQVNPSSNIHGFPRDFVFGPEYRALENVEQFTETGGLGLIDEASAAQTALATNELPEPLGPGPIRFFDATFQAQMVGSFNLQGDAADRPENQIVVLRPGQPDPVPTTAVEYGSLSLQVIAPIGAVADMFTRNEDLAGADPTLSSSTLNVLANDTRVNGNPAAPGDLSIVQLQIGNQMGQQITLPSGSTVAISQNRQTLTYTPAPNFFGIEASFTYTVQDQTAPAGNNTDSAAVTIAVNEVNDAPNAADDTYTTGFESQLTVSAPGVLGNDTDPDNQDGITGNEDTVTVTQVNGSAANVGVATPTTGGTVTLNADGSFTFTPNAGFEGPASFTYQASDGRGGVDNATVTITVEGDPSAAVIVNVTDLNGNPLPGGANPQLSLGQQFIVQVQVQDLRDASETRLGLGIFSAFVDLMYPAALLDFVGPITFGSNYSHPQLADPGDTTADGVIDDIGSPQTDLFRGPIGAGPFTLFTAVMEAEQFGTATITAGPADETGHEIQLFDPPTILPDSDIRFGSATVTIVNPNAGTPTANPDTYSVAAGGTLDITTRANGVLGNDVDPEGDNTIQAVLVAGSGPTNGTLVRFDRNGTFTYRPNAGFFGTDTFQYQATDGGPLSAPVTVTINVGAGLVNDTFAGQIDQPLQGNVLANDTVPAGATVTAVNGSAAAIGTQIALPSGGRLTMNANGNFTYLPAAGRAYVDTFTYSVGNQTATVTLNIGTAPTSLSGMVWVDEDNSRRMEMDERRLGGITITLRNNQTGQTFTTETAADGSYTFPSVPGGNYTITAEQPAFMLDGWNIINGQQAIQSDTITLNLSGPAQRVDFSELGLRAEFITPEDFFGTADPNGFAVATNVNAALGQEHWFSFFDGWTGGAKVEASVNADATQVTLRVTRNGQVTTLSNINIASDPRVRLLGRMGDGVVIRFEGTPADFAAPAAASGEAEGEAYQDAVDRAFAEGWNG